MKTYKLTFLISIIVLSFAKCNENNLELTLSQKLQNALDKEFKAFNGKGVTAAVLVPGRDIWVGVSGVSFEKTLITPEMTFCVGSITKTFTATLILKLAEERKLSINDSLNNWLPPFQNIESSITIRQLLNHTSGVFNYTEHPSYDEALLSNLEKFWTPEEVLTNFVQAPHFNPGTNWGYSNTNYILLGMIIKKVTGDNVSNQLRNYLFGPLGLSNTFLGVEEVTNWTIAHPWYDIDEDGEFEDITELSRTALESMDWTAGAIYSTAKDLVKFSNALLFEKKVLNQSTLDQMLDFYPLGDLGYGYGISIAQDFIVGVQGIGNDGYTPGYGGRLVYIPQYGVSIAILVNNGDFDCRTAISRALAQVILDNQ